MTKKKKQHQNPPKKTPKTSSGDILMKMIRDHSMIILFVLFAAIILAVFNDYIFQRSLYLFQDIASDSLNGYYARFVHFARYIREEGIPMWSFSQGMGQNLYPGHINDPFYLIYYFVGAEKVASTIIYVEISKFLLAGVLTYSYLRLINISKYVSVVGGLTMAFLGYIILGSSGWYGHSTDVLLGIFLLFSFEMYYKKQRWYYLPIAVFLVVANPFRLFLFGIFLFTYIIMRIVDEHGLNYKKIGRVLFFVGLLGAIGFLMSAVFSFGSLYKMINSPRVSGDVGHFSSLKDNPVFAFAPAIHNITAIMRLFSNNLLGVGSNFKGWYNYLEAPVFYTGLLTLILVPQLFVNIDKRKRIIYGAFILLWIIPVIFPYFRYALNAFVGEYYKHGLSLFIPLVLLFMGMVSFSNIVKTNKINPWVLFFTVLGLLSLLYYPYFMSDKFPKRFHPVETDYRNTVRNFILVYGLLVFMIQYKKARNYVYILILIVLCLELGIQANWTVNERDALTRKEYKAKTGYNDYTIEALNQIKKRDSGFFRLSKNYFSNYTKHASLNNAKIQGYFGTPSYYSFNQLNYIRFLKNMNIIEPGKETQTRWANGFMGRPLLQTFGSIKYMLIKGNAGQVYKMMYDSITTVGDVKIYKNKYFLPLGFTYDKYITYKQFKTIKNQTVKDVLMFKSCVLEEGSYPVLRDNLVHAGIPSPKYTFQMLASDVAQRKSDHFNITKFSENHITGTIDIDKHKMLLFTIPYDRGWSATVNGKYIDLQRVNIGFTGILLEPGKHNIKLKYTLPNIKAGLIISLFGLFIFILLFVLDKKFSLFKTDKHTDVD